MANQSPLFRPAYLLQAEGLCALIASCGAFHLLFPHHWLIFACLFFVPDLSLLTYAQGPSAWASATYNVMHTYVLPALLGLLAAFVQSPLLGEMSLVWIATLVWTGRLVSASSTPLPLPLRTSTAQPTQ